MNQRAPAIRKPTPAEELAKLHPVERLLYRVFEFLASLKLAIFLMSWLIVECTVGTFVESQVHTPGAWYFVYGHWRFGLLLALLALNVLSAALIRFPWRRYQTGFVITHAGLLTILAGSMITAMNHLDTVMPVEEGKKANKIYDQSTQRMIVTTRTADGKQSRQVIPVNFGPFTWGHKVFGTIPWGKDHVEEFQLETGDTLRITKYYANCLPEKTYVADESGPPAVQYRLFNPKRADMTDWIVAEDMGDTGRANLGPATIILWGSDSDAEFEHFLKAVPREPSSGLLGSLGYSHAGKHHVFSVEELRKAPLTVPGTDIQIQVAEYLPNAKPGPKGKLISEGDVPVNPALVIKVTQGGKEKEYLTFGAVPEFNKILAKRQGTDHLFSYFPADLPSVVHLTVLKDGSGKGRLGYRAFGKDGLIAAEEATLNKEYPSIAGFSFVPKSFLTGSHPDLLLKPQPPKRGKEGTPGVVVELQSGKEMLKTGLTRGMTNGKRFGERVVTVSYDIVETEVPFEIRLDSFEEPKNPGTRMAAMYTSKVTLFEPSGREQTAVVTMNAPLHYTDSAGNHYTLYQSGIDRPQGEDGPAVSTFTVAHDPGLNVKYAGAIMMCTGIVIMFYLGGYFKKSPGRPETSKVSKPQTSEALAATT